MLELYLISRLDAIIILMWVICGISIIWFFCNIVYLDDKVLKELKSKKIKCPKEIRLPFIIMIISILGLTATPSTKDAYVIYGAGTVIEYVKKDTAAQQIPHKAIVALDKYLNSLEEDKHDERN